MLKGCMESVKYREVLKVLNCLVVPNEMITFAV